MSSLHRYDSPVLVDVCVTYVKIGDVDTVRHRYEADLLIASKWREPRLDKDRQIPSPLDWRKQWSPKLCVTNSLGLTEESHAFALLHDSGGQATVEKSWRLQGVFQESWDLAAFPFDCQDLSIVITSERSRVEVKLSEDPNEMHRVDRHCIPQHREWTVFRYVMSELRSCGAAAEEEGRDRTPCLMVKCRIARKSTVFFWNFFFVTLLVSSLALATFSVSRRVTAGRLQLGLTLLLASLVLRMVGQAGMPRLPQLTYIDKYVLYSLTLQAGVCAWHALVPRLPRSHAAVMDKCAFWIFLSYAAVFNVVYMLHICLLALRKRRETESMENVYLARLHESNHRLCPNKSLTNTMLDIGRVLTGNKNFKGW